MSIFLATYSTSPTLPLVSNKSGGGSININAGKILTFTNDSVPSKVEGNPWPVSGDTIYLDIEGITADKLANYNRWAFGITGFDEMNFVYYLRPSGTTNVETISNKFNNTTDGFDNIYCPYGTVSIDVNSNIEKIDLSWINAENLDVSTMTKITTLTLNNCRNLTNIDGVNFGTITDFSIVNDVGLTGYLTKNLSSMTNISSLQIGGLGLTEIPDLSKLSNLSSLGIYYNNLSGALNLGALPESLIGINANGNKYTDIIFPNYKEVNGIRYGIPNDNLIVLWASENNINSFSCDCNNLTSLILAVNPLKNIHLKNIDKLYDFRLECCELQSIYIDGLYMNKCSEIKKYIMTNYSDRINDFRIHNNHLIMDEQGLNINEGKYIYLSPQFIGDNLSYDPTASNIISTVRTFNSATGIINSETKDPDFSILNSSIYHNVDFNNIDSYCEKYSDEFIKQKVLTYEFQNSFLNIYNAQNLLNNPNSTLSKALKIAGKYYKLKGIKTNNTNISKFFPNTPIIFTDSPSQIPSIFSINMIVNE